MAIIKCAHCDTDIEIPEGYDAPYIQCPDCRSMQKYVKDTTGEPKYKILDTKGQVIKPVETNIEKPVIDQRQLLIDSMGEDGLEKVYKLVKAYMGKSESAKKNARAKAIQQLLKEKYTIDVATRAVSFVEKNPTFQELKKSDTNKLRIIIAALVVVALIVIFLSL